MWPHGRVHFFLDRHIPDLCEMENAYEKCSLIRLCNSYHIIAAVVLIIMALLTFVDIVMRYMGKPLPGAYEIVAYLGVAVVGFALPRASLMKTHVYVDLLLIK